MQRTRSIDFSKLTLRDALDFGFLVEEEARERYEELAHQMELHHNPDVATFFRFMVKVESIHASKLAHRRRILFGDAPRAVTAAMLFDIEAPEYDEVRTGTTPRQALNVALGAERKAYEFFVAALNSVTDPEVRTLFAEFRDDELQHAGLIEQELAKLAPEPETAIKAEDVEDEPVAH